MSGGLVEASLLKRAADARPVGAPAVRAVRVAAVIKSAGPAATSAAATAWVARVAGRWGEAAGRDGLHLRAAELPAQAVKRLFLHTLSKPLKMRKMPVLSRDGVPTHKPLVRPNNIFNQVPCL